MINFIPPVDVKEWNGDISISLSELAKLIPKLQAKYGKNARVAFDAGANNVSVIVYPSKKTKNG